MTALFAESLWKGSLILAAAFAANFVLRRGSAAARHFVWTAAFAALLLLPAAILLIPRWSPAPPVATPASSVRAVAQTVRVAVPSRPASPARTPVLPLVLPFVLMGGCLIAASRFLLGAGRTSWMVRRAVDAAHAGALLQHLTRSLGIRRPVRVIQTALAPMPMTWGVARPVVVLPDDAASWPEGRLHAVLLHELVHVQRLDLLAQAVAQAACSLYWFHPLAWLALVQLRKEREHACDDAVLQRGVAAPEYAGHLMDLVRSLAARRTRWANAPAMAEVSGLESRIRAVLDRGCNRRPVSRRAALAIAAVTAAVLLPFAGITAHAQGRGAIAGVVKDPSGARVPFCRVTAKNLDGSNQEAAFANPAGEYQFSSIPSGRYVLEFAAPGFTPAKVETTLVTGAADRVDANLAVGSISEMVVVRGQKTPSTPAPTTTPPQTGASQRIKVGGSVTAARLVRQAKPVYPAELQQLGVQGSVVMSAIISKNGTVLNPVVRNTVDPRLAQAALDAVKQWVYQPALLNGEPIETLTTITLDFQLEQ